jgi:hypothetical protein
MEDKPLRIILKCLWCPFDEVFLAATLGPSEPEPSSIDRPDLEIMGMDKVQQLVQLIFVLLLAIDIGCSPPLRHEDQIG